LLLSPHLQKKFFANFSKITDENTRRRLMDFQFVLPAATSEEKTNDLPAAVMRKMESLAALPSKDFLVWVENMVQKDSGQKDFLADIGASLKTSLDKYEQVLASSKEGQEQLIAKLRQRNKDNREKALRKPTSRLGRFFYPLKRLWARLKGY
jgi:hypothetical protein